MTDNVNLSKFVSYAVEQTTDALRLSKDITYAVEQTVGARLSKNVSYAVEQVQYFELYQDDPSKRPVYRAAPSGGIPYVDMSATSAELKVRVVESDTYTFIIYNADETFTVVEEDLTAGDNVVPITEDFNQCVMIRGVNIHRFAVESVKEGMKARV